MPVVQCGSESIYYDKSESTTTPALIPIHGAGGCVHHWPSELRGLENRCVCTPDLPGHGQSPGEGRTSVAAYADFIETFVTTLNLDRAVLMGHSLGGAIALTTALASPEWLSGLILVGAGARLRVTPAILDGLLSEFEQTVGGICDLLFGPSASGPLRERARAGFLEAGPRVLHGDFSACDRFDVMDRIADIAVPTLVVSGAEDMLTPPKFGEFLRSRIPGAEHTVIPGAGHMMATEKPGAFLNAISGFF